MGPKTRSSAKSNESNIKASKRKRQPSENENTNNAEVSDEKSEHENEEPDQEPEFKEKKIKEEEEYGKFQKYNKDKEWRMNKIHHYLLPSFSITKDTDLNNLREFPLVKVSLPHSIFVNSKFPDNIDICHRRTIALNSYMCRLKTVKAAYLTARKSKKNVRKDEKKGIYCQTLVAFAERREFHPDKYFQKDYDFYYTGGNLSINKRLNHIAHVAGTDMNTLVLSVLNVQNNVPKVHKLTTLDFNNGPKDECEIFEVQTSMSHDDYLFIRQKHCVSIHELRNRNLSLIQNFKTKDVPFISFTQDPVNTHHLTISDLVHKVRVCDLERGVPIQTLKMVPGDKIKPANNWNMIKSIDNHVYLYAETKHIRVIDTRLPENEWKGNYCGVTTGTSCYNFCSLARSKFENLFYVGSNHKAYCVDRRYMGKDIDSKNAVVCNWTHQMSSYPLIMDTSCHNDVEYIAMQSPLNTDLRILENMQSWQDNESKTDVMKRARTEEYLYSSPCLPYMPRSIESTLEEARSLGKCIKTSTGICDRVKACITGLVFTDDAASQYLLTATSNGDLFARQTYNPDLDVKPDTSTASEVMSIFEDNIFRSVRKNPLDLTEVANMVGISKVFRCPILSGTKKADNFDLPPTRRNMGRWQKSVQTLSRYKDALAADLISVWDFDIDNEKDLNITALNKTETADSKVSGWLENTEEIAHSTMFNMTSIPFDVLNSTKASNSGPALADTSLNDLDQTINQSKIDLDQSVTVKPNKVAKKKSRYIKGF